MEDEEGYFVIESYEQNTSLTVSSVNQIHEDTKTDSSLKKELEKGDVESKKEQQYPSKSVIKRERERERDRERDRGRERDRERERQRERETHREKETDRLTFTFNFFF